MRYADLTLAYTSTSGGIRTYIDQKRRYLRNETDDEHLLVIPGETDQVETAERTITVTIASSMIPGCEPYRFFWRPDKVLAALRRYQPDLIELGSFFTSPWAAFRYREERQGRGTPCPVTGYFHTDLANAYFRSPIRELMTENLAGWSEPLAAVGSRIGELIATGATGYFGSVFQKCDRMFAATEVQAASLTAYGVEEVSIVPLGTDLERFSPSKRSEALRAELGAGPQTVVLFYAGRLDSEKRVHLLLDAFEQLDLPDVRLVLSGAGPERARLAERAENLRGVQLLAYQTEPERLAAYYASADVYVTAGPHETFGLAVVEAQASGLPVVGVRSGALVERVPPEVGRLGPVDDAATMARNIEEVVANLPTLRAAARRYVEEQGYSWNKTFELLLGFYSELSDPVPPAE